MSNLPSVRTRRDGLTRSYPVAASTHLYYGDLIVINSSGYAIAAAASASNKGCVGVCMGEVDNSSGSNGTLRVEVKECEVLLFDDGGETLTVANVLVPVYASGAQKIHLTQASNEPFIGMAIELDPTITTGMWVLVGPSVRRS